MPECGLGHLNKTTINCSTRIHYFSQPQFQSTTSS